MCRRFATPGPALESPKRADLISECLDLAAYQALYSHAHGSYGTLRS